MTTSPIISLSGVRRMFGDLAAVDDISLEIRKGEMFGFLGPNGAGKTTTINMICGLLEPTEGEITILGKKITGNANIKTKIGICPQENNFWPKLTCGEQLMFLANMYGISGTAAKQSAENLLELLGLKEKAGTLADKLSGGMKRRLSICLALVHDPEIIILDEPEAGLDPQSRILVREFLKSLSEKRTVLFTTHNMDEADRLADHVAIIDHGKLLMLDSPENLKRSTGEGDILEITLESETDINVQKILKTAKTVLLEKHCTIRTTGNRLIIKAQNVLGAVPELTIRIKSLGYTIQQMTMRENTLEDVFIYLTGRDLRQ